MYLFLHQYNNVLESRKMVQITFLWVRNRDAAAEDRCADVGRVECGIRV